MLANETVFQGAVATVLAQVGVQSDPQLIDTARETTLAFSGPQFFTALVAGLFLTFGFQMLLTNFSVAAGISVFSLAPNDHESSGGGSSMGTIGKAVGLWTLVTVSIALFVASLLAVKLSFVTTTIMGVTVGLVIWASYFSILVWISSTTVGSLVGSVVSTATKGFQTVFGTATAALGVKAAGSELVSSAEAAAAAVRREMTAYVDPQDVQESFGKLISTVRSPELNLQGIREQFEKILKESDADLKGLVSGENLPTVSRETFENLLKERTDLSPRDVKKIVNELDQSWQGALKSLKSGGGLSDLLKFAKSAKPRELLSQEFAKQLGQFVKDARAQQNPSQLEQGISALLGAIVGRVDLSDLDVGKIKGQLKSAQAQVQDRVSAVSEQVASSTLSPGAAVIRSDVEDYLRHTYAWQLSQVETDFRALLYDPNADARTIRQGIESLKDSDFTFILQSRGVFTQAKIADLTDKLEQVRQQVLAEVREAEAAEALEDTRQAVSHYLHTTPKEEFLSVEASQSFKALLTDPEADPQELHDRLVQLQQKNVLSDLQQRTDLNSVEKTHLSDAFTQVLTVAIADSKGLKEGAQARVDLQWQKVQDYLRSTGKSELDPEGIKHDLKTLLDDPQVGFYDLKLRASRFDRDTLVQLLSQQENLSEDQVKSVLDQVESSWKQVIHAPEDLAHQAKVKYEDTTAAIAAYLRDTGKSELNPEGIKRDLSTLLEDPKTGLSLIRDRLAQVDRDTLVQLLSQRDDLTEEEVNATIDQVQDTIRQVLRTPRRLALRAQEKVQNFQTALEDYLRNTDKAELNPDGIKRDLGLLFQDPRLGVNQLGDRLSQVDRSTVVALLSQREDISEAEAEEIVDRVLAVRDRLMAQIEAIKAKIESVIEGILGKIRDYLNGLERPELNYDGIKQDVRTLFDDPNAGFEALRDRLSQFDRDTLVAVISSRDDISEADANRVIDQVDQVRTNVLQRAERIQHQIQSRLDDIKRQAQEQAEVTRKAAATAAWWLFATALSSGIAAGLAGAIAVSPVSG
ncbi:MAG: apolipoprotein A1/A4/E family protein [Thermosynechococcaceae cyanobacterium MS004]|nr:apolipoprotein A1/A4/E family protein [Thermosynechococcaceae cyanobacterium MS004]